MITAIAPCRINDLGGWTDTRWAKHGAVHSIAVWPGAEVQINEMPGILSSVSIENYDAFIYTNIHDNKALKKAHPAIAAAFKEWVKPEDRISVNIFSGMPPGSGTGTSAAVMVALVGALDAWKGTLLFSKIQSISHDYEKNAGIETGIQDNVSARFGGVRRYEIEYPWGHFSNSTTGELPHEYFAEIESRLILVYLGKAHVSSDVHKQVIENLGAHPDQSDPIKCLRKIASEAGTAIERGDWEEYGNLMRANTECQRRLWSGTISKDAENVFGIALKHGALGYKVNGAGGDGGSVTILTDGDMAKKHRLEKVFEEKGFKVIPISIAREGLQVWRSE